MQQHDYPIHKNDYNATDEGNEPEQRGDYNEAYINEKPIQPKKISKHSEDAIIPAGIYTYFYIFLMLKFLNIINTYA